MSSLANHCFQWLDALALVPATLEARLRKRSFDKVDRSLRCTTEMDAGRLQLNAPFSSRLALRADSKSKVVAAIAPGLHAMGAIMNASSDAFAQLPLNRIPKRIAPIFWDRFPELDELMTADAIELQLLATSPAEAQVAGAIRSPLWPIDVADAGRLAKKIQSLRFLVKEQIPIGAAIPRGATNVDARFLAKSGVDFVSFVDPLEKRLESQGVPEVWQVVAARRSAVECGRPNLPLFFELPFRDGLDIAKWIALGASGIILDSFLEPILQEKTPDEEEPEGGLLSDMGFSIRSSPAITVPANISRSVQQIVGELTNTLIRCDCESLSQLRSKHIVATSDEVHRLTGAPLLS